VEQLPDIVPIFPLPNVVFFPHVDLPLHIFEPRYREMVRDAMATDRLIGMTLLRGDWRKDYHGSPDVYPVGCVGRIESFALLPDGRSNLILHGLRRFEIVEEVGSASYRRARVRWCSDGAVEGAVAAATNARLKASVTRLLSRVENAVPDDLWQRLPDETEKLVNALAFALEFSTMEKLALLECADIPSRAERLLEIIEFRLAEYRPASRGGRDEERWH
jgi:Lon protease-like protein